MTNIFCNSGKHSLVPYTKDIGRITHFEVKTWQLCNLQRSALNRFQVTRFKTKVQIHFEIPHKIVYLCTFK